MKKTQNKKKKKILIKIIFIGCIIIFLSNLLIIKNKTTFNKSENKYLASNTNKVAIYQKQEDGTLTETKTIARGTKITTNNKNEIIDNINYIKVKINNKEYYIKEENLTNNKEKIVKETTIYDRTPTYILENVETGKINGLVNKTNELQVLGYDKIDEEGNVNIYHIKKDELEGYIYGKYTTFTKEEANINYNSEIYDPIHSSIKNTYNGGTAIKLDFYPVEKPKFENNKMPNSVYALYLNNGTNTIKNIDNYIEFAKDTKINTFVIDIKDNETPGYPAETFKTLSPTNYKHAINSYENYQNAITKLKENGFYVIGRITVFKDSYYIKDHPEDAITNKNTQQPYLHNGSYWPSPYDRDVWYYNVTLAKEAVEKFGFNEINFDYVRFPDRMQSVENTVDLLNTYNEEKTQAIQRFVQYACDELHKLEVYVSIDVFGETTNGTYTTAYGQYWPAISNVADVISGMPYPDHFSKGYYGIDKPWNNPYKLINTWAKYGSDRQKEIPTPAIARTWIQAYDVMKYVDPNGISYNANELESEIRGLYEGGLTGGYITWLSNSNLEKYNLQKKAFQIDYAKEYNQ